jgi:serine/threonine protein kinase
MSNLIGQSLGRYLILERLGEGGMATVYKANDTRLERDVAIKVIRVDQFAPAILERLLKRFDREAKSLARLTHPYIVPVIDYGDYESIPYLVMTYLPGGTLNQQLSTLMPWREAVRILLPIAEALSYAHGHNIIHRDIKPSNILLTEKGQPMLSDFGIAKILEGEETATLTGTGVGVGTPEYMAPEQWTGHTSPQSDIYSLGVVFYELVTGRKPFTADTPAALLLKQANDPLPRPRSIVPDLPDRVEKVILKVLAKKPEDRYSSMGEFITAVEALLSGHTKIKQSALPPEKPKAEESLPAEQAVPPGNLPNRNQPTQDARRSEVEKARLKEQDRQKIALEGKARLESEERLREKAELHAHQAAQEQSRREAQEREERATTQRAAETTRLQHAPEITLGSGQSGEARQPISQLNNLGSGGQASSDRSQKRLPKPKIPVWIWAVIGLVIVGIFMGAVFLIGRFATQKLPTETPRPLIQATEIPTLKSVYTNTPTIISYTPTFTPASTDTPLPLVVLHVNVNVRTGPGTMYPIKTVYTAGTQVKILGRNHAGDWLVLALPGNEQGWVAASSLQVGFDVNTLTELNAPPPPISTLIPTKKPYGSAILVPPSLKGESPLPRENSLRQAVADLSAAGLLLLVAFMQKDRLVRRSHRMVKTGMIYLVHLFINI